MPKKTPPLEHERLKWSDYTDPKAGRVVPAVVNAPDIIREKFLRGLKQVLEKSNRHEIVDVHWWYPPFIYVEVRDTRWKHYPCGHRFLVSFCLDDALWASPDSPNHYCYARKGWIPFGERLIGRKPQVYCDCGDRNKTTFC